MLVSLTPTVKQNTTNFQAQKSTNVLENSLNLPRSAKKTDEFVLSDKDKIEIQSRKVKNAVKRCVGVILLADILYFAVKRKFKLGKIAKHDAIIDKRNKLVAPPSGLPKIF